MSFIFFIPLVFIAFYESVFDTQKHTEYRDPIVEDPTCEGLQISKVPFSELIKVFPDTTQSSEATVLKEIADVKKQIQGLLTKLDTLQS